MFEDDAEARFNQVSPRLARQLLNAVPPAPTTVPPHTHDSSQIGRAPSGNLVSTNDQTGMEELDVEKLARDGSQEMLGILDMGDFAIKDADGLHLKGTADIDGVKLLEFDDTAKGEAKITEVRSIFFEGSEVGEGIIDSPRVIHMIGDDSDGEALIDGLERTTFNNEPTKSVVDYPSRIDFNPGVAAGSDWTLAQGRVGHDSLEQTIVGVVESGSNDPGGGPVPTFAIVALGWTVVNCIAFETE